MSANSNFVLIGAAGAGKSTIGELTAKKLNMKFIDTDKKVAELIVKNDLAGSFLRAASSFLGFQRETLAKLVRNSKNTIISTGAEVVMDNESREMLPKLGNIILITRKFNKLIENSRNSRIQFVNISSGRNKKIDYNAVALKEYLDSPFFELLANFKISNNGTPEKAVNELVKFIQKTNSL